MRKKLYNVFNKTYGILMTASFFGGFLPLIPFIFAIIVGGKLGEDISVFLYKQYYPWVIIIFSVAIIIGLIAMYIGKMEGLSVKKVSAKEETNVKKDQSSSDK